MSNPYKVHALEQGALETTLLAPIAIFVYKRDQHALRMLSSLQACDEFRQSPVTIYCDGPKTREDEEGVVRTRRLVKSMVPHADIVERDRNVGCADSIIAGVTETCDRHGRAIVVEDDLVFSPFALQYFNDALRIYEREERVMHVACSRPLFLSGSHLLGMGHLEAGMAALRTGPAKVDRLAPGE